MTPQQKNHNTNTISTSKITTTTCILNNFDTNTNPPKVIGCCHKKKHKYKRIVSGLLSQCIAMSCHLKTEGETTWALASVV